MECTLKYQKTSSIFQKRSIRDTVQFWASISDSNKLVFIILRIKQSFVDYVEQNVEHGAVSQFLKQELTESNDKFQKLYIEWVLPKGTKKIQNQKHSYIGFINLPIEYTK